jgi:hypothetical protein
MSIAWMVVISLLIAAEKLLPWRALATTGVAALVAAIAVGVAAAPAAVPALTLPGSPAAMRVMRSMGVSSRGAVQMPSRHMQMPGRPMPMASRHMPTPSRHMPMASP